MIGLLALLFRVLILAAFTFVFSALYEYGPTGFVDGLPKQFDELVNFAKNPHIPVPAVDQTPAPANNTVNPAS